MNKCPWCGVRELPPKANRCAEGIGVRFWGHVRQAASARSEVSPEGSAIRDMRKGATSRQHAVYLCSKRVHVSHGSQYSNECVAGNEALVGRFQAAFNKARLRQAL